jgi:CRISPR system Cascade subunit CasE
MFLHRIEPDPRCREARRDLADPYQMHATLCRAFHDSGTRCPPGTFLWRQEAPSGANQPTRLLIQARTVADWARIDIAGWLRHADPALNLDERLKLSAVTEGERFRFRMRANPTVTRNGRRTGLLRREEQEGWLLRKGEQHGFSIPTSTSLNGGVSIRISQEKMLIGRKHDGVEIRVFSVLFDGELQVTNAAAFRSAVELGVGHGKALGLGLLSIAQIG